MKNAKTSRKTEEPQAVSRRRLMKFLTAAAMASPAAALIAAEQSPTKAPATVAVEKISYVPCDGLKALQAALMKDNQAIAAASNDPQAVKDLTKMLNDFLTGGDFEYGGMLVRIVKVDPKAGNQPPKPKRK